MISRLGTQAVKVISGVNTSAVLPNGLLELEYIESTGAQTINPDVTITADIGFEVTIDVATSSNGVIIGSYLPGMSNYMLYSYSNGNMTFFNGLNNPTISLTVPRNTKGTIKVENGVISNTFDSSSQSLSGSLSGEVGNSLYLFSGRPSTSSNPFFSTCKMYRCKIFDGNTTLRDFIPCYRVSDGYIGMYDTVGGQFYTTTSETPFERGSFVSIPLEYQEVDISTLNWSYTSASEFFYCSLPNMKRHQTSNLPDLHLPGYTTRIYGGPDGVAYIDAQDMGVSSNTESFTPPRLVIKNKSFNDVNAFKNASKGVLLTYAVEVPDIIYPKSKFEMNIKLS